MSKQTIYIAGPMTGIKDYNKPAFDAAAERVKEVWSNNGAPVAVINPATNFGGDQTMTHAEYMRYSIHQLLIADAVYMLEGWECSRGAQCEHTVAQALGLDIYYE